MYPKITLNSAPLASQLLGLQVFTTTFSLYSARDQAQAFVQLRSHVPDPQDVLLYEPLLWEVRQPGADREAFRA